MGLRSADVPVASSVLTVSCIVHSSFMLHVVFSRLQEFLERWEDALWSYSKAVAIAEIEWGVDHPKTYGLI